MSKKIEFNEDGMTVENTEVKTHKSFSQSDLVNDMKADNILGTPYINKPAQDGRFDNWKCLVFSRINVLQVLLLLSSFGSLVLTSPEIQAVLPPNWYPYIVATVSVITILERTLTKDHKNLI